MSEPVNELRHVSELDEHCSAASRRSWKALAKSSGCSLPAWVADEHANPQSTSSSVSRWLEEQEPAISRAFAVSEFLAETLIKRFELIVKHVAEGLDQPWTKADFEALLATLWEISDSTESYDKQFPMKLRLFRALAQFRIIWRDLVVCNSLSETTQEESWLATICLQAAHDFWFNELGRRHGLPLRDGKPQQMVILGMGKLGSGELNVSSDIDLIFFYEKNCGDTEVPEGATSSASGSKIRALETEAFYRKLAQGVIGTLDQRTPEGFVFRVDMRLRPFGRDGALAASFSAAKQYYFNHGRYWERFAMLKARPVAGDIEAGHRLLQILDSFIFRNYIDFTALQALRDMKALIEQEVVRRNLKNNIKLGAGGIRELEFVVQVLQLMHGGRMPELKHGSLVGVLGKLAKARLFDRDNCAELEEAYNFLRNLEHALQGLRDQQTQLLPVDEADQARIALAMNADSYDALMNAMNGHRKRVREIFSGVVTPASHSELVDLGLVAHDSEHVSDDVLDAVDWWACWHAICAEYRIEASRGPEDDERQPTGALNARSTRSVGYDPNKLLNTVDVDGLNRIFAAMQSAGLEPASRSDTEALVARVGKLMHLGLFRQLRPLALRRVHTLMPLALRSLFRFDASEVLCERFFDLLEQIIGRSVHMSLLIEHPVALHELFNLLHDSLWISVQLAAQPVLLNELVQHEWIYTPPDVATLNDQLRQELLRIPEDDLEEQMDALRYFKKAHELRVAASEIRETLPLMKVSDYLSSIAESILGEALHFAWRDVVGKYGRPMRDASTPCDPDFAIIAYGKLGGLELGYSSDLDLVFLHDADGELETDGAKPVENNVFFARLGQRIIHFLSTRTVLGELYETDMRLRPSGNSGLLVSSLLAFERYQCERAWTWETQALTRARYVAGCPRVGDKFDAVRKNVLCQKRPVGKLSTDVLDMRDKMRKQFSAAARRELKHAPGGIVDIEFMVQYSVLRWANEYPAVARWSDNIRILESLSTHGCIDEAVAARLAAIYQLFRSELHSLALGLKFGEQSDGVGSNTRISMEEGAELVERLLPEREEVIALWQNWFEPADETTTDEEE